MKLLEDLRSLALSGLNYFQTYDWLMLMTVITLGYVGWMVYIVVHLLESYTSLPEKLFQKEQLFDLRKNSPKVTEFVLLLQGSFLFFLGSGGQSDEVN